MSRTGVSEAHKRWGTAEPFPIVLILFLLKGGADRAAPTPTGIIQTLPNLFYTEFNICLVQTGKAKLTNWDLQDTYVYIIKV